MNYRPSNSEEIGNERVAPGSDMAEVLQAAEGVLNQLRFAISLCVVANGALAVAALGHDGGHACLTERTVQAVGIVAFVTEQVPHASRTFEKGGCCLDGAAVARCQHQRMGTTDNISERMGLYQ